MSGIVDTRWAIRFPDDVSMRRTRALVLTAARLTDSRVGEVVEEAIICMLEVRLGRALAQAVIERVGGQDR